MLRKKKLLSAFLIVIVLIITGCSKEGEIKLGFLGDLSGNSSYLSRSGVQGAQLAIDEFNNSGGYEGKSINLIIKDNFGDQEKNGSLLDEFEEENIEVVIGPYLSQMIVPEIEYLHTKELLLISPTVSSDKLSGLDDNFIRVNDVLNRQATVLVDLAIKNEDNRILVIYNNMNESFTEAFVDSFTKNFIKKDGEIVNIISYSDILEDIDSMLQIVQKESFDGIVFLGNGFDTAFLAQNLNKQALDKQLYLSLWSNTKDLLHEGGDSINDAYILDFIDRESESADYRAFQINYADKYGEEPTFSSVFTYEATKLYIEAIKSVGPSDWKAIKDKIIDMRYVNGLQKTYEIDKYGDSSRGYIPFQIKNGKFKIVK